MTDRFADADPWVRDALTRLLRCREPGLFMEPKIHSVFDKREEGVVITRDGRHVLDCWNKQTSIRVGVYAPGWDAARVGAYSGVTDVKAQKKYVRAHVSAPDGVRLIEAVLRIELGDVAEGTR